ncbi:hypothetical protein MMC16_000982 [Acarospora aff. strigata]|nr:hypothetical protein [Acarospora aff. strigata]
MSTNEVNRLCNDLQVFNIDGLCTSRDSLYRAVEASADVTPIHAASDEIRRRLSDSTTVSIYSINPDVDQLLRVLVAASRAKENQVPIIVAVDTGHFAVTVETFSKLLQKRRDLD